MKIYFTASLTGKQFYRQNYERICECLTKLGNDVSNIVMTNELEEVLDHTRDQNVEAHQKIKRMIKNADLVVAEASYSSIAVGFEITSALYMSKKVLLLHVPEKYSPLLEGAKDPNLYIVEYTENNLEAKIAIVLRTIEKSVSIRFNFFLPKELSAQLDSVALNQRVNKSEYIRQLIEKDMKKNKRYLQE